MKEKNVLPFKFRCNIGVRIIKEMLCSVASETPCINNIPYILKMSDTNIIVSNVKVKCTLVQALRHSTGRTAHRGSRGIALLFHDHGTRRG